MHDPDTMTMDYKTAYNKLFEAFLRIAYRHDVVEIENEALRAENAKLRASLLALTKGNPQ